MVSHNYITAAQAALFAAIILIISTYHFYTTRYINRTLRKLSIRMRFSILLKLLPNQYSLRRINKIHFKKLKQVFKLHGHLSYIYMISYGEFWSSATFYFFFSSIPFNITCMLALNDKEITTQFVIAILIICSTNSMLILFTLLLMASQTETLHQPRKYLPLIIKQIKFDSNWKFKLKMENWYCRLSSGRKYGPFVANIGHITYYKVFEVKFHSIFFLRIQIELINFALPFQILIIYVGLFLFLFARKDFLYEN